MSMLSAQIDHLRELADALDGKYGHQGYAIAMRDAADTIWQLRDDLQRANAAVQDAEHEESVAWDRVRKAEAENAKLRELMRDMLPFAEVGMDDTCVVRRCCLFEQCEHVVGVKCAIEQHMLDRMRELGVEADDE